MDEACDSFLTAYNLFGDIASISDDSEGSALNDSLDDVMASDVEDDPRSVNTNIIESRNISLDDDVNINETTVNVNTGCNCVVPVSTYDATPVNVDLNCNKNDEGNDIRASATCNTSNEENTTTEVTVNVEMDDEVFNSRNTETGVNSNGVNDDMISDSNVVSAVEHAAPEARETPAGIAVDGLDEATGDDMDCDVVPVSQVSVVDDDDIIEVLETGFSGNRLMDTDARTGAGHSQSPADVADSICSTNDAQILPFSQEGVRVVRVVRPSPGRRSLKVY